MFSRKKKNSSPPHTQNPLKNMKRSLGVTLLVFFLGLFFTWQIFDLIRHPRLPTMQETMEETVDELENQINQFFGERFFHIRALAQILAYQPSMAEQEFAKAASDLISRFNEWKWLRCRMNGAVESWSQVYQQDLFQTPAHLQSVMARERDSEDMKYLFGEDTFVYQIPETKEKYYAVKVNIPQTSGAGGMLWALVDLSELVKSFFARHKQDVYHYVVSAGGITLATDLGFHNDLDAHRAYQVTRRVKWGSYTFRLDVWPRPDYLSRRSLELNMDLAGIVFVGMGVLFSAAMAILVWNVATRTRTLRVEVAKRTAELSTKNALLKAKNEEVENFIYTISHDLKSPIVSIQGFASILMEDFAKKVGEPVVSHLGRIQANTVKMHRLIQDLLELSRIGKVDEKPELVNVTELVREIIGERHSEIDRRHAQVVVDKELPSVVFPKIRLHQVFDNLITNAIKYSDDSRAPEVHVDTNGNDLASPFYHFKVRDNGIGINKEYLDKVFQIFQRVPNEKKVEGTGIGLSIVKKIIEQHGGTIRVESEPGAGSMFEFTIPREEKAA